MDMEKRASNRSSLFILAANALPLSESISAQVPAIPSSSHRIVRKFLFAISLTPRRL